MIPHTATEGSRTRGVSVLHGLGLRGPRRKSVPPTPRPTFCFNGRRSEKVRSDSVQGVVVRGSNVYSTSVVSGRVIDEGEEGTE